MSAPFKPPTVEEVAAYCEQRSNDIDPIEFVDFYQASGWVQGRARKPIRDWKACVRTWEASRRKEKRGRPRPDFDQGESP